MNKFLRTRSEIELSTKWLKDNGYKSHPISCKNFELRLIVEALKDGDLIDAGADGSFILHNASIKNIKGRKVGIDLAEVTGDNKAEGAEYFKGDLMHTPFEDGSFDTVVSMSVLEHQVGFSEFAKEMSRLLRVGGKLYVTFDYFDPKVNTDGMELYGLKWNILNKEDVLNLVWACSENGLGLTSNIDWYTEDAVINPSYCSPFNVSYTFGILELIKVRQ